MKMPQPPPPSLSSQQQQHQKRDSGLGSDGESPRTSDEDMHNALAFRRSHLRSYSLRQRRGSSRNPNSVARSSTRRMHRVANDETTGTIDQDRKLKRKAATTAATAATLIFQYLTLVTLFDIAPCSQSLRTDCLMHQTQPVAIL